MANFTIRVTDIPRTLMVCRKAGVTPLFLGAPGCGKTAMVREGGAAIKAKENLLSFTVREEILTRMEAPDLGGFVIPDKEMRADGSKHAITTRARSPLIPNEEVDPYGILFLDEFVQSSEDVQKAAASFLHDAQKFGMPAGWSVCGAGNRAKDKAGVVRMLSHILNRVNVYHVTPHVDGWATWAASNNIHPLFIGFAKFKPGAVFLDGPPENKSKDGEPMPYCTARSFSKASDLCVAGSESLDKSGLPYIDTTSSLVMADVAGSIGEGTTAELFAFMRVAEQLPEIGQIIRNPEGIAMPTRPDVLFALAQMVVHFADKDTLDPLFRFTTRFPQEFMVSMVKQLMVKCGTTIALSPTFKMWAAKNSDIILKSHAL